MRDDRSDDTARFMQAIAAFSDEPEPVGELGRKIADHPDAAVSAILSEIDETVLRRNLTFVAQSGEMVQIDVAERRVFRVLAIPMDWRDAFAPLVGVDCSGRQGAELMQLFMMFAETASPIYVSADLPDRCKTAGFMGVTLRELRDVYTDLKALSGLPAPLAIALGSLLSHTTASCIVSSGRVLHTSGDEAFQAALRSVCQTVSLETQAQPVVRLWQGGLPQDVAALAATSGDVTLALAVSNEAMISAYAKLRRAFAPDAGAP
ncbi:MAG: hypothetical protein AAGF27_07050 [Pseudomonadota bacterium]